MDDHLKTHPAECIGQYLNRGDNLIGKVVFSLQLAVFLLVEKVAVICITVGGGWFRLDPTGGQVAEVLQIITPAGVEVVAGWDGWGATPLH